ncbi:MAG TPA: GNAT family N-acetyltransferase [Edaphobacter sp.]|jgi:ribosomal protein S18 acetylase RimI-like enzyme|nr:GNAT family N-acetyltransferase [Edaphobacter sp.]
MLLIPAVESDYPTIIDLANLAYRGTGPDASWNIENFIEGQRLNDSLLREELATKPCAHLLTYREEATSPILGTVLLEPKSNGSWYLGLLTINPRLQKQQRGRTLLTAAEEFAREHGASRIEMTVINLRDTLIAWYRRRGYTLTTETRPFPYGDERFGRPLRNDLYFVVLEKIL